MDLGLSYRALGEEKIDLIAGDATAGLIDSLDLFVLEDDKRYFPPYQAVPFVRSQSLDRHAGLRQALAALGGKISDIEMRRLNLAVEGEHRDATRNSPVWPIRHLGWCSRPAPGSWSPDCARRAPWPGWARHGTGSASMRRRS
jgi:hypothetical protein